ncbi:MAG: hypothetical protein MUF64_20645 [Polyangiaceae bacterium]|jgi:recombination protein RecA|nr:hypothetical protein [Polyangiaceae bacterium]
MGSRQTDGVLPGAKYLQATAPPPRLPPPLPTGLPELDALLPGGGLAWGSVVELMAPRGLGLSTSLALALCAAVQRQGRGWCAFVDPTRSLHPAGVEACGVDLGRLLVVRPPVDGLGRAALRVAQSRQFSAVVVDTGGVPGAVFTDSLGPWVAQARRLATASEGGAAISVLLTHREMSRTMPLPVAERIELTQERPGRLLLRVHRHRYGLPSEWQACRFPSQLRSPLVAPAHEAS